MKAKILLREWVNKNVEPAIVELTQEEGHEIIFTPPHFSDLQPIELLWARVKGKIAGCYNNDTRFEDLKHKLIDQFDRLSGVEGSTAIRSMVNHVDSVINKFSQELEDVIDCDGFGTNDDDSDSELTVTDNSSISEVEF